ncbi:hypothetical protein MUK42_29926 [Musa troglodytarum]|uniref:Uncharacterized protein n=1 Tax=Musa troglodytarum TaxID=320322 RepID=A0A9E7K069_9LILI|nr:hypothetical protein MUK42_29926 [Musa troglodytarum]
MAEVTTANPASRRAGVLMNEKARQGSVVGRDDESGAVRVKIVMTKKQLRQMVAAMQQGRSYTASHPPSASLNLEQLLRSLRSRHMKRAEAGQCRSRWRPELQSIPE